MLALGFGFFAATGLALAKAARSRWLRKPAEWFIFLFRGSPLFIQFFLAYEALVLLPRTGHRPVRPDHRHLVADHAPGRGR